MNSPCLSNLRAPLAASPLTLTDSKIVAGILASTGIVFTAEEIVLYFTNMTKQVEAEATREAEWEGLTREQTLDKLIAA